MTGAKGWAGVAKAHSLVGVELQENFHAFVLAVNCKIKGLKKGGGGKDGVPSAGPVYQKAANLLGLG